MRRHEFALLIWLTFVARAGAADIFVDNLQGDDRRDGTATVAANRLSGPLRSITQALRICRAGDRIVLAKTDRPYRESLSLSGARHSGSLWQPFIIEGNGATLDGAEPIPHSEWQHDRGAIFRYRPARTSFQQLFLDGKPAVRRYLASPHGRLPDLKPLEWCLYNGSIHFCVEQDKLPEDYHLSCAALSVGITLYEVHDLVISDLVVQGYQLDGVNAHDGVKECLLTGLTSRGNGRAGIAVMNASRVEIAGCLVGDNGMAQLYTEGQSLASVEDSQLLSGAAPAMIGRGRRLFVDGKQLETPK